MSAAISGIRLDEGWLPILTCALAAVCLVAVIVLLVVRRAPMRTIVGAFLGVAVGLGLTWLLSDRLDLFDVSLSPISRAWVAAAFGGVGVAVGGLAPTPARGLATPRRIAAVLLVPSALLAGGLGVNADFGQYTTVGSLAGTSVAGPLSTEIAARQAAGAPGAAAPGTPATTGAAATLTSWRSSDAVSTHGDVASVTIPATASGFAARSAYLYLPPAALVAHPPALPVLMMLSGQPGGPANVVQSGAIDRIEDAFADAHHGVAPIVVIPDQLSAPAVNPMCVDSKLGNSASYLTVDVPNWIRTHLTVQTTPGAWAIGGFSQGGTCAIQLGAAHPELFSAIVDVSGQLVPRNGNVQQTIDRGFGGSAAAYAAAAPEKILADHAPYSDETAVFGSGQYDTKYGPGVTAMAAAAKAAGVAVTRVVSPGTAHDWHTVQWVLRTSLAPVYRHLGLES